MAADWVHSSAANRAMWARKVIAAAKARLWRSAKPARGRVRLAPAGVVPLSIVRRSGRESEARGTTGDDIAMLLNEKCSHYGTNRSPEFRTRFGRSHCIGPA